MSFWAYILLAFTSLFVIVDAPGAVPAFLAMTPGNTYEERVRMAWLASWVAGGILAFFCLTGTALFRLFSITLPAFQIAGSLLLLLVALDMVRARRSRVHETEEEKQAGTSKDDVAITPLAVPMLAGPGAITTTILMRTRASGAVQVVVLLLCIAAVCTLTYWILRLAARGSNWLSPIALKVTTRLMGLLLGAVAVQFILNALRAIGALPY